MASPISSSAEAISRDDATDVTERPAVTVAHAGAHPLFGMADLLLPIARHLDRPKDLLSLAQVNKAFAATAWPLMLLSALKSDKPMQAADFDKLFVALDVELPVESRTTQTSGSPSRFDLMLPHDVRGEIVRVAAGKLAQAWQGSELLARHQALAAAREPLQGAPRLQALTGLGMAAFNLASNDVYPQIRTVRYELKSYPPRQQAPVYVSMMSAWVSTSSADAERKHHPKVFEHVRQAVLEDTKTWDPPQRGQVRAAVAGASMRVLDDRKRAETVGVFRKIVSDKDVASEQAPVYASLVQNFALGGSALDMPTWRVGDRIDGLSGLAVFGALAPKVLRWDAAIQGPVAAQLPYLLRACPFDPDQARPEDVARPVPALPRSSQELIVFLTEQLAPTLAPASQIELATNLLSVATEWRALAHLPFEATWHLALFDFAHRTLQACPNQVDSQAYDSAVERMVGMLQDQLSRSHFLPDADLLRRLDGVLELALELPVRSAFMRVLDAGGSAFNQRLHARYPGALEVVQHAFDTLCERHAAQARALCDELLSQKRFCPQIKNYALDLSKLPGPAA